MYFYYNSPSLRVVTEVDMYLPKNQVLAKRWTQDLEASDKQGLSSQTEVYIVLPDNDDDEPAYFILDHDCQRRVLTYLGCDLSQSPSIGAELQVRYWQHVERFPSHLPAPNKALVDRLIDILSREAISE